MTTNAILFDPSPLKELNNTEMDKTLLKQSNELLLTFKNHKYILF